jgi:maltodextrin utilization protein YvdJ
MVVLTVVMVVVEGISSFVAIATIGHCCILNINVMSLPAMVPVAV